MNRTEEIQLTEPVCGDGPVMQQIARETGVLSVNSAYYYALMARCFRNTCLTARYQGHVCAYLTALFPPERPDTLFVWQIGVAGAFQGRGIGKKMLIALVKKTRPSFIEATIEPGNAASLAAFQSVARHFHADWAFSPAAFFDQADLGPEEAVEHLMRIGPMTLP